MGSIGQNSTFSRTASTQTNKDIMRGSRNFLSGGRGGGGRLHNLFYSLQRGSNGFITHFPGGPTFSRGWGGGVQMLISIETHITITCDFPGWSGPPIPPSGSAHGQCGILARIGSDEPLRPPFKLRNSKC